MKNYLKTLPIVDSLWNGWKKTVDNFWVVVNTVLLWMLIVLIVKLGSVKLEDMGNDGIIALVLAKNILLFLFNTVFDAAIIAVIVRFLFQIYRGHRTGAMMLFKPIKNFYNFFIIYTTLSIAIFTGAFLLIVPAFYIAVTYLFSLYLAIDKHLGIKASFLKSREICYGYRLELLKFGLLIIGINLLGAALFMVGLVITIPVTFLSIIFVYEYLLERDTVDEKEEPVAVVPPQY